MSRPRPIRDWRSQMNTRPDFDLPLRKINTQGQGQGEERKP